MILKIVCFQIIYGYHATLLCVDHIPYWMLCTALSITEGAIQTRRVQRIATGMINIK